MSVGSKGGGPGRHAGGERRSGVTRLRALTAEQEQRLVALRLAARLLDSSIAVPGTAYRIGLDPILGLVPVLGDMISPLLTIAMLWQARDLRLPRIVQLRMVINVAIDTLGGLVPFAGDLFDVAWKANEKNMRLLDRYAYEERPASAGDWLFVVGLITLLVVLAVLPPLLFIGLLSRVFTAWMTP